MLDETTPEPTPDPTTCTMPMPQASPARVAACVNRAASELAAYGLLVPIQDFGSLMLVCYFASRLGNPVGQIRPIFSPRPLVRGWEARA